MISHIGLLTASDMTENKNVVYVIGSRSRHAHFDTGLERADSLALSVAWDNANVGTILNQTALALLKPWANWLRMMAHIWDNTPDLGRKDSTRLHARLNRFQGWLRDQPLSWRPEHLFAAILKHPSFLDPLVSWYDAF